MNLKIREEEILKKLREIEDTIKIIEEKLPSELEDFLQLGLIKDGIYKKIEFAIEDVIDICAILNSDLSLGVPADDEDIINNIETKKILNKETTKQIREMKAFRNILVHKYGKIDDEIAFETLQNNLGDFKLFKEEILKFLKKKQNKN